MFRGRLVLLEGFFSAPRRVLLPGRKRTGQTRRTFERSAGILACACGGAPLLAQACPANPCGAGKNACAPGASLSHGMLAFSNSEAVETREPWVETGARLLPVRRVD